jgi:hypothetical protein
MKEITGDLWGQICDARVVTTNGSLARQGRGVMGRGVAKEARDHYFAVERKLGRLLRQFGNHVMVLAEEPIPLIAMPVKHQWHEPADYELIRRSAVELVHLVEQRHWETVVLPRPGCGNGKLYWTHVEKILRPLLDDRFVVVYRGTGKSWEA